MAHRTPLTAALRRRFAALCVAVSAVAALGVDAVIDTARAQGHGASQPVARPVVNARPTWAELSPGHQKVLAPLQPLWDTIPELNRRKWQRIADLYPRLKPEEQARLQERMAEWVSMTPQQRRLARENYQITRTLPQEKKAEAWDRYQQLPEDQKKKLAAAEKVPGRPGAVSALPSGKRPLPESSRPAHHPSRKAASHPEAAPASAPAAEAVAGASAPALPVAPAAVPGAGASAVAAATADSLTPPVTGEASTNFPQSEAPRQ
ncbi:DUF3106 domain-containing protein [Cupriavidus agavae]|uniref:Uncharacterized protein DUF3106 n=1 Tax=Cupriavidus agavae TaxID=1001822 RepID=A0A4Q7S8N8_9BURK|nr:DUF3106 domain-containing protein [Cupriavidus agavae]RZT42703.1 uncharacterized protein DUF3106 [Cupriavidus agavae]